MRRWRRRRRRKNKKKKMMMMIMEKEDEDEDEDMREVRLLEIERREGGVYTTNSDMDEEEKATKGAWREGEEEREE
jgi:hypothetical protein